jgi:NAD(P)-dependent dehydrogenase (short-subunit alcohol dehydrogenase family)
MASTPVPTPTPERARRWFITGASGGLGRHLTERALAQGDDVIATWRSPPLRLTLGADAHQTIEQTLHERLSALQSQRELAASVAFPA